MYDDARRNEPVISCHQHEYEGVMQRNLLAVLEINIKFGKNCFILRVRFGKSPKVKERPSWTRKPYVYSVRIFHPRLLKTPFVLVSRITSHRLIHRRSSRPFRIEQFIPNACVRQTCGYVIEEGQNVLWCVPRLRWDAFVSEVSRDSIDMLINLDARTHCGINCSRDILHLRLDTTDTQSAARTASYRV